MSFKTDLQAMVAGSIFALLFCTLAVLMVLLTIGYSAGMVAPPVWFFITILLSVMPGGLCGSGAFHGGSEEDFRGDCLDCREKEHYPRKKREDRKASGTSDNCDTFRWR